MVKPKAPDGDSQFRQAALDLALQAYDNHKSHARFQETQRSWFFIAYFSISGVIGSAILNRMLQPGALDPVTRATILIGLIVLILTGIMIAMAIVKVGVEFRRHFHRAEGIVAIFERSVGQDEPLKGLLKLAKMGTAGDENIGARRFLARSFGVAAIHNYMMSLLVGMEVAIAGTLVLPSPAWAALTFPLSTSVVIAGLQAYRRTISTALD